MSSRFSQGLKTLGADAPQKRGEAPQPRPVTVPEPQHDPEGQGGYMAPSRRGKKAVTGSVYVPPHRRGATGGSDAGPSTSGSQSAQNTGSRDRYVHIRQLSKDTCAVACCLMALTTQMSGEPPTWTQLLDYMKDRGIYAEGRESSFGGLHYVFTRAKLRYDYVAHASWAEIKKATDAGAVAIIQVINILGGGGHVVVIDGVFGSGPDYTVDLRDPASSDGICDYKVSGYRIEKWTGAVYFVWPG